MNWNEITGQDAAVRFLRRALAAGRLPGLLLFTGPRGVGKRTAAEAFAAAALCESDEGTGENRDEACGRCTACREFAAGVHADLILPKVIDKEKGPPVRYLTDEDRIITLTRTVRPLLEDVRFRSARGGRRVVLLRRAERLNEESQNTLLKSLEEPADGLVWVLTSDEPARLLETVRSRATKVRFGRVPAELVAKGLEAGLAGMGPVPPDRAGEVALAAEGSFARAAEILSEGWRADCEFVESEVVPKLGAGPAAGPALARELVQRAKSTSHKGKKAGAKGTEGKGARREGPEPARRAALRLVGVLATTLRDHLRRGVVAHGGANPEEVDVWAAGLKAALDSEAALRQNVRVELALTVAGLRLARGY